MKVRYYPTSDMLVFDVRAVPATGGGEEVVEGVTFSYDEQDRLVLVEIDNASTRVDLTDIRADSTCIIDDSGDPVTTYSVSELAQELGIGSRALQKTIKAMAVTGIYVGRKEDKIPNAPIILSTADADQIRQWRAGHRPGRQSAMRSND
jgi:biotin operon repressor